MRTTRDTFIHFVADNIASYYTSAIPVRGVWRSGTITNQDLIQTNAINIGFIDGTYDTHVNMQVACIDVVHIDELTAIDWTDALWTLLSASCFTPEYNYSGSTPTLTGANVIWPMSGVRFRPITTDVHYFRYNCRLPLHTQN